MLRKIRMPALLLLATAAAAEAGGGKIAVSYSLLLEGDGTPAAAANPLRGFESGDGFRLRLQPRQECYAYVVVQRDEDDFRLLYPDPRSERGRNRLAKGEELTWPRQGWLRLDEESGSERVYLILSAEQILELEARFALRRNAFPESVIVDIRDRYQGDSSYRRKVDAERVKVRFKSRDGEPALLIEEVLLRHL